MRLWIFSFFLIYEFELRADTHLTKFSDRCKLESHSVAAKKTTLNFICQQAQDIDSKSKKPRAQLEIDSDDLVKLEKAFPENAWKKGLIDLTAFGHWKKAHELFVASQIQLIGETGKSLWLTAPSQGAVGKSKDSTLKKHNPNLDYLLL